VVVLSTARPASHRGIPSLPVPGRRRAPGISFFSIVLANIVVAIFVNPALAAPELRWIGYLRADAGSDYRGSVEIVRSDGKAPRTLLDEGVLALDLGPGGDVYAARAESVVGDSGPTSSVIVAPLTDGLPKQLHAAEAGTYYYGLATSSDGDVAMLRRVTKEPAIPPFLRSGIDVLRSTTIPILVPPEWPPETVLVPTGEEDSYQLLFTNDPTGELAHVEQVNVFVAGTSGAPTAPESQSQQVNVRGTDGEFFCGASTCFLSWGELGTTYTVGEFGSSEEAAAFAESLIPIDSLAGSEWRESPVEPILTPQLLLRDHGGRVRILETVEEFCDCGFRPLDWSSENDRILVLTSAEGDTTLHEYRADGSTAPRRIAEGRADPQRRAILRDGAYGPDGVVAQFGGKAGSPGTLRRLDGGETLATDVRAFDIEGSTLAYVNWAGDVIVRNLSTGNERTIGKGAMDVSVGPDLIRESETAQQDDGGLPVGLAVVIGLAGLALLTGAALFLVARRRGLD
jgi:hypothetical protein